MSVAEQLLVVRNHLVRSGTATFRALTADCAHTLEVVARFLALLELYRQQRVVVRAADAAGRAARAVDRRHGCRRRTDDDAGDAGQTQRGRRRRGVLVTASTNEPTPDRPRSPGTRWPPSWPPPGRQAESRGDADPATWDAVADGARRPGGRAAGRGAARAAAPCRSRTPDVEPPQDPTPADVPAGEPAPDEEPAEEPLELLLDPAELRGGLEALLFVMDDPVDEETLAGALRCPVDQVRTGLAELAAGYDAAARPGSRCAGWGRGGGSTPARSTPPSSSATWSTGSAAGSPRPRWRPSPSSPTASR